MVGQDLQGDALLSDSAHSLLVHLRVVDTQTTEDCKRLQQTKHSGVNVSQTRKPRSDNGTCITACAVDALQTPATNNKDIKIFRQEMAVQRRSRLGQCSCLLLIFRLQSITNSCRNQQERQTFYGAVLMWLFAMFCLESQKRSNDKCCLLLISQTVEHHKLLQEPI